VAGFAVINPDAVAGYYEKVDEKDDVVEGSELVQGGKLKGLRWLVWQRK
jgi:hypothetical protein